MGYADIRMWENTRNFAKRSCPLPPVALIAEEGSIGYPLDH